MTSFAAKTATASFFFCALLLLLSSPARAEPSHPPATEAADQLANVLTFTPEQVAAAESALNSTASAVFAAYNRTKAAKAAFFQDAIATPFGQLKAGGLRAGGLVKRTNRTSEKSDWLTSELALAPVARAFSQVSAAVESSPVGKAFAATTKPSTEAASAAADATESDGKFALPTPRQVLTRVGSELRLPGGGPAEDVAAAVSEVKNAAAASAAVKP